MSCRALLSVNALQATTSSARRAWRVSGGVAVVALLLVLLASAADFLLYGASFTPFLFFILLIIGVSGLTLIAVVQSHPAWQRLRRRLQHGGVFTASEARETDMWMLYTWVVAVPLFLVLIFGAGMLCRLPPSLDAKDAVGSRWRKYTEWWWVFAPLWAAEAYVRGPVAGEGPRTCRVE